MHFGFGIKQLLDSHSARGYVRELRSGKGQKLLLVITVSAEHFACPKESMEVTSGMQMMGGVPNIYSIAQKKMKIHTSLMFQTRKGVLIIIFVVLWLKPVIKSIAKAHCVHCKK